MKQNIYGGKEEYYQALNEIHRSKPIFETLTSQTWSSGVNRQWDFVERKFRFRICAHYISWRTCIAGINRKFLSGV